MIFWLFQILIDIALVGTALAWILSRKRIAHLEEQVGQLTAARSGYVENLEPSVAVPAAPISLGPQLQERKIESEAPPSRSMTSSLEAFERAGTLLARGLDPREISKQTGLSIAELQLLGKVSHRTQ